MKKAIVIIMLVALIATMFTGCTQQVKGTVVSCEKGRIIKNDGAKTMAAYHMASGNFSKGLLYSNIARIETQKYDVVVEYEDCLYTIETDDEYKAGDSIWFYVPVE